MALRALRGEDLDALSRELGVAAGPIDQWREQFLAGGQEAEMMGKAAYEQGR